MAAVELVLEGEALPPPRFASSSVDGASAAASIGAFPRNTSLPSDDVVAWLREKFPQLPPDECVDASYSCALVRGILLQGRLYVTRTALVFYAKIFGRITKEYISLLAVRSVKKRKTGFVANSIKVTFLDPEAPAIIFGSLSRRERACALITARLVAINPEAATALDEEDADADGSPDDLSQEQRLPPRAASTHIPTRVPSRLTSGNDEHAETYGAEEESRLGDFTHIAANRSRSVPPGQIAFTHTHSASDSGNEDDHDALDDIGHRVVEADPGDSDAPDYFAAETFSLRGGSSDAPTVAPSGLPQAELRAQLQAHVHSQSESRSATVSFSDDDRSVRETSTATPQKRGLPRASRSARSTPRPPSRDSSAPAMSPSVTPLNLAPNPTAKGGHGMLWRVAEDPMDAVAGHEFGRRVEQARATMPASVKVVFDALFSGDWVRDVCEKNGNTEISLSPWTRADDGYMTREMRFSRALGYRIGPKTTRVVETHKYSFTSSGGVVFETSGHNLDVPFGDMFRVEGFYELSPVDANSTEIVANVAIYFAKSTMLRSKIENGALSETKLTMARMLELAAMRVESAGSETAPPLVPPSKQLPRAKNADPVEASHVTKPPRHDDTSDATFVRRESGKLRKSKQRRAADAIDPVPRTRSGSNPPLHAPVPHYPAGVSANDASPRTLQVITVALLAVIASLLLVCMALLFRLQIDVLRLERMALVRQTTTAGSAGIDAVCQAAKDS